MKKILSLTILSALILGTISVSAAPAYSDSVAPLISELKIMQGDPDGNMRLDDLVSRAECAKIAVNTSSFRDSVSLGSKTSPFYDVTANHWAAPYVTVAVKNGLCRGYLDASFKPQNNVSYEEALTMFLRVLGYSEEDYGASWPEGPISLAKNIGLCDNLSRIAGEALSRRDVMNIVYNLLNTPAKNTNSDFISDFNRSITDDVILISADSSKITTSLGTYNAGESFNHSDVGKSGSIVLRNNDTIVSFISDEKGNTKEYIVNSVSSNGVVTYNNGIFDKLELTSGTIFYDGGTKTSFASVSQKISMGDILSVSFKDNGEVDFVIYKKGTTVGPVTVKSSDLYSTFGVDSNSVTIMRDGVRAETSDVKTNDIAYYSKDLNMILVYSKKVTGIYESASPNKEAPLSVTVSGTTYSLEGVNAVSKLSSSGSFNYGDTVTLLLGKNGDVCDVLSQNEVSDTVYGFLTATGTKETTVNGTSVIKPYVRVAFADGSTSEFVTSKEYDSILNSVVKVTFDGGIAKVTSTNPKSSVSGKFTWTNSTKALGSSKLSSDVNIIEVSTTNSGETAQTATVFPQRLNGITLSSTTVLYAKTNSSGEVSELILDDVTGDMYDYGIITAAKSNGIGMSVSGSYSYLLDGTERSFSTNGTAFSVVKGEAVKIVSKGNSVSSLTPLTKISSGKLSDISGSTVTYGGKSYTLSDKVSIYTKDSGNNYSMITLDELENSLNNYSVTLYTDKNSSSNGRIRIILALKK